MSSQVVWDWVAFLSRVDLRLGAFLPGYLVPIEAAPAVLSGFFLLFVSIYTLTIDNPALVPVRIALAPLAIHFFWDFGYGGYATPANQVSVGMAVIAVYGVMRVLETTFVGLLDAHPPRWVRAGKALPMPETTIDRACYAFDLATSLRGNSWFADTHWDWAPRSLVNVPTTRVTRAQFVRRALWSVARQLLLIDIFDTLNKSRTWDTSLRHPITSLPLPEQLAFAFSNCACTALAIILPYTLISAACVALGCAPTNWPPMFDTPFSATSLADFWTRRWHLMFRRVFGRLTTGILSPLPRSTPPPIARALRALTIFALSASLHILLMYRIDRHASDDPLPLFDISVLEFFLSQPLGLLIEAFIIVPLARAFVLEQWQTAVTRVWAWGFMLWSGRIWTDVWVNRGLWQERERAVGYSPMRRILYGKWTT